jgi:hypothetical protein
MESREKRIHSEDEKLQIRLTMTYTERFKLPIRLIKISRKLSSATITYPSDK